jgi:hypothetical protein
VLVRTDAPLEDALLDGIAGLRAQRVVDPDRPRQLDAERDAKLADLDALESRTPDIERHLAL